MNCTKAGSTQCNPRVTDMVWIATLQIAHYSRVNIPTRSPPAFLPGERTSAPHDRISLLPHPFLSSHHAPKKSISKRGITLFQTSSTPQQHSMPFIVLIRYFKANLIIYLHLNLDGRQRAMIGRQRAMVGRRRAMARRHSSPNLPKAYVCTPKGYGWTPKGYGYSPKGYGWTPKGYPET